MTIEFLQEELEAINGVHAPRVRDFIVGREVARRHVGDPRALETLLVRESDGGVELALFLDDAVVLAAQRTDAQHRRPGLVRRRVLHPVACAAEGVSHFIYVATRAAAGRPVSLLELEIQAEVDKFVLLLLHLWRRGLRRTSRALRRRLFERVRYHAHLAPSELERYRLANRLAGGYARWLESRFVEGADADGLLREVRATYRRGGADKIAYLEARGAAV
jgi:hypothetical protein